MRLYGSKPIRPGGRVVLVPFGLLLAALLWGAGAAGLAAQEERGVPFVPTPMEVVHTILETVEVAAADTVYDLGSGDGRIPIVAARDFGAVGVGVDLDSSLVALSRRKAREAGVQDRVRFVRGDLFEVDLRPASVLALYLNTPFNLRLRPKILEQMRPGSRVVSHVFDMGQWQAETVIRQIQFGAFLYVWTVPAVVEGGWSVTVGSREEFRVELDQKFQRFCTPAGSAASGRRVEGGILQGDSVRFTIPGLGGPEETRSFTGTVSADRMSGRTADGVSWSATREGEEEGSLERWESDSETRGSTAPCSKPADP